MSDPAERQSMGDRRAAATRAAIVDAAWALSRELGLMGWTLRELARRVDLKAPTLYAYFESKHAIYDAMFRQGHQAADELFASWEPLFDAGVPPRRLLRTAMAGFFRFCVADPTRYQLMFQRVIPDFEPSPAAYAASQANYERFRRQAAALGVTADADLDLWTAIGTGLADQQISNDPGGDRWERLIDTAVDLFCHHVGIPPDPEGASR